MKFLTHALAVGLGVGFAGLLSMSPASAEVSGYVAFETRIFEYSPQYLGQKDGPAASFIFEPEFYREWRDGRLAFEVTPYVRLDSVDGERELFDLRELSFLWVEGNWEARIGVSKVFWGVAESQHLVDTINQTDLVANPDGEEKLGQPMIHVVRVTDFGDFGVFILPGFRERAFPGREGRLRGDLWVDTDHPLYESSGKDERVDLALRWKHYAGPLDIGLHYFNGTNREPRLAPGVDAAGRAVLRPYYELMDQIGLDLQVTQNGWLWKLEALARETENDRYAAMVGGFEYTLYGVAGSTLDLGLLAEAHLDSRGAAAPTPLNRDVFVGSRLTWNDEADSSLVGGFFVDADTGSIFGRLEFERRLRGGYKLEVEVQKTGNARRADPLYSIRKDGYVQLALSRYF